MSAKKRPGSVHTARNGARYKILANGRARFISGPTKKKTTRKRKTGGSARVGGAARKRKGGGLGLAKKLRAPLRSLNPGVFDAVEKAGHFMLY